MGYNTDFHGELLFTKPITDEQEAKLNSMFRQDCRQHPEWGAKNLTWINLTWNADGTGIEWNGDEKSYDMVEKVNLILSEMRKQWPKFGLKGTMYAAGDESDDRWVLTMTGRNGTAKAKYVPTLGDKINCPKCKHSFKLEAK